MALNTKMPWFGIKKRYIAVIRLALRRLRLKSANIKRHVTIERHRVGGNKKKEEYHIRILRETVSLRVIVSIPAGQAITF